MRIAESAAALLREDAPTTGTALPPVPASEADDPLLDDAPGPGAAAAGSSTAQASS